MNIFEKIEKGWDFKKSVKHNTLTFNTVQKQERKNRNKMIVFGLLITGIALFFHNPILGMAFIIGSVTYGSTSQWTNSTGTYYSFICGIDATHFAVVGQDAVGGNRGLYIRIASISGSTISWGTAYRATTSNEDQCTGIDCLDSTHLVISYYNSNNHYAKVAVFSGTTVSSVGTASSGIYVGSPYGVDDSAMKALSSSTFVMCYRDQSSSSYGTAILGSVSGTTISWGTANQYSGYITTACDIAKIDSTHFVIAYRRYVSGVNYGSAIIGTVSGTTLSFGTAVDVRAQVSYQNKTIGVAMLDSTHFVMSYTNYDNSALVCAASISGTTITFGSEVYAFTYSSGSSYNYGTAVVTFDSTNFVVCYYKPTYGVPIYARPGTVSGTTITLGDENNFDSNGNTERATSSGANISICKLDGTHIAIDYTGGTSNRSYYAIVGVGSFLVAPTVTTQAVSDKATTSGTGNGNITDTGGENCTRRGFCYKQGTTGDPTTSDSTAYDDGSYGTGAFTKSITGLTAGTAYRVRAYAVNSVGTSYGSTVDYVTVSEVSVTKSVKYTVKTTPSALTKSLKYTVKSNPSAITKSLKYTVKITPSAVTKSLTYLVKQTITAITKGLIYEVKTVPTAQTKQLKYEVKSPIEITKALKYTLKITISDITKSLKYEIKITPSAITKSLKYEIKITPSALTKALNYCVLTIPNAITKGLRYAVRPSINITKGMTYIVISPVSITKSLKYTILTIPSAITKGLRYSINPSNSITKSLKYTILTTPNAITKTFSYIVVFRFSITKALQYVVVAPTSVTKSLKYVITITPSTITKSLGYKIKKENSITKSMRYVIRVYPYRKKTSPYTKL